MAARADKRDANGHTSLAEIATHNETRRSVDHEARDHPEHRRERNRTSAGDRETAAAAFMTGRRQDLESSISRHRPVGTQNNLDRHRRRPACALEFLDDYYWHFLSTSTRVYIGLRGRSQASGPGRICILRSQVHACTIRTTGLLGTGHDHDQIQAAVAELMHANV